jgi:hypothetical protein
LLFVICFYLLPLHEEAQVLHGPLVAFLGLFFFNLEDSWFWERVIWFFEFWVSCFFEEATLDSLK